MPYKVLLNEVTVLCDTAWEVVGLVLLLNPGQKLEPMPPLSAAVRPGNDPTDPPEAQPAPETNGTPAPDGQAGADEAEIFALLDAGQLSLADIARSRRMKYNHVNAVRHRWEAKTGKTYVSPFKYVAPSKPRADTDEQDPPPATPVAIAKTVAESKLADEPSHRIEEYLRKFGPTPYSRLLEGAVLSPEQFNSCLPHPNVIKMDGLWQIAPRIE